MHHSSMVQHSRWLDGVRGIAALVVVFGHCSNAKMHVIPGLNLEATAKTGVWIFFMLSAYLLGDRLIKDLDGPLAKHRTLLNYAVRRLLRIMPLYATILLALVLLGQFTVDTTYSHLLLLEGKDHFWTMPVEMTFYLVLPVLAVLLVPLSKLQRAAFTLLGYVAALVWYAYGVPD